MAIAVLPGDPLAVAVVGTALSIVGGLLYHQDWVIA
jgi:hypothetical protein